jgi:heptosyltransferase III
MQKNEIRHIVLSRTDSIGDVVLTLPMAAALKARFPGCVVTFIGRHYTEAVIRSCSAVDRFISKDDHADLSGILSSLSADVIVHVFPDREVMQAAARALIPVRIATAGRWASWRWATHRPRFSRKRSGLHESQLNFHLLRPLGIREIPELREIASLYSIRTTADIPGAVSCMLQRGKIHVVLHPLSKGSAVNWGLGDFHELAALLPPERFQIFITGTAAEGELIRAGFAFDLPHVHDVTGKMTLGELLSFIAQCDALVAASTGPLHLAAAMGIRAIGLFSPKRPIHPGRWAPVGEAAETFVSAEHPEEGHTLDIDPNLVATGLLVLSEERA